MKKPIATRSFIARSLCCTHGTSRRIILGMLGVCLVSAPAAFTKEPQSSAGKTAVSSQDAAKVNWDVLLPFDEERHILQLKFVMYKIDHQGRQSLFLPRERKDGFELVTKDPTVLAMAESFCRCPGESGWATIVNTSRRTCLYVTPWAALKSQPVVGSSTLGSPRVALPWDVKHPSIKNLFYGWGLAKMLDDLLIKHKQPGLGTAVFEKLSGESRIQSEKETYKRMREEGAAENGEKKQPRRERRKEE